MNYPKIIESFQKIRFQDCDPFNHLNNGKYVDYFINAREDQLIENYDIDLFKIIREEGLGWVVANNQIAYIKPVFTMETVCIESQLLSYSEKHIKVEMRMWNSDKSILKSVAWFSFVPFNLRKNKIEPHGKKYIDLFEKIILEISEITFENRELSFRRKKQK